MTQTKRFAATLLVALFPALGLSEGGCTPNLDALGSKVSCVNQAKDMDETDVDCGGPLCLQCLKGQACAVDLDCVSNVCRKGVCTDLSCTTQAMCPTGSVCTSGSCVVELCLDKIRSGAESDVDCGGNSTCSRCELGKSCTQATDCKSNYCGNMVCGTDPCTNTVLDKGESDVDCGGESACARCRDAKTCTSNGDCLSGRCAKSICVPATCANGILDSTESDVDCGGLCATCEVGAKCGLSADCASTYCVDLVCATSLPSCTDGLKNQDETDVDCGGGCSPGAACGTGKSCTKSKDCLSNFCLQGACFERPAVDPTRLIDDFEDNNPNLPSMNGRGGTPWVQTDDMSFGSMKGGGAPIPSPLPDAAGTSLYALHASGTGFVRWGYYLAFDFRPVVMGPQPFDASNFKGITFWARGESTQSVDIGLADMNVDYRVCFSGTCDYIATTTNLSTEWQRYEIPFTKFGGLDKARLTAMRIAPTVLGSSFDFWLDDLAFY